ncbi:MAG: hypothetical protein WAK60_06525 [Sedimentisphaerales bacterium]
MKIRQRNNGSVFLIAVFAVALLATLTACILQMSTEEVMLMQNQTHAAQVLATTEIGLNDAFAGIRQGTDPNIAGEFFNGGSYAVTAGSSAVSDLLITSTATTS